MFRFSNISAKNELSLSDSRQYFKHFGKILNKFTSGLKFEFYPVVLFCGTQDSHLQIMKSKNMYLRLWFLSWNNKNRNWITNMGS